jgi:hypothetical protein
MPDTLHKPYKALFLSWGVMPDEYEITPDGINVFAHLHWDSLDKSEEFPVQLLNVQGNCGLSDSKIKTTTNFPRSVKGWFMAPKALKELNNLPKKVGERIWLPFANKILLPSAFIPVLFIETALVIIGTPRSKNLPNLMDDILNDGRIDGKMPRELIPGKINQLRDLDEVVKAHPKQD